MASSSDAVGAATVKAGGKKALKVAEPKVEEYKAKIAEEKHAVDALMKKKNQLDKQIKDQKSGQSEYINKRNSLRSKLDQITGKIQDLDTERSQLFAEIDESHKTGRDMKTKVQAMKRNLGFQSEEEIDAKIRELERLMMGRSLAVQEENKLIAHIQKLQASKPLVGRYADLEAHAAVHSQAAVGPLRSRYEKIKEELRECQQTKRELTDQVRALIQENQRSLSPLKELNEEREVLRKQIAVHRNEEARLSDELNLKTREYQAWMAQVQRENQEKWRKEKKRRDADNERQQLQRELEEIDDELWTPQYHLAQQTVAYVRKLEERARSGDKSPSTTDTVVHEPLRVQCDDDVVVVLPKCQREEEYYFAPMKKKGDKKMKKHAVSLTQPLVHDITTLADFERLGVDPPLSLEQCADCLEAVEGKLEALKNQQKRQAEIALQKKHDLQVRLEALEARWTLSENHSTEFVN